jgi:hypothetical protein
MLFLKRFLVFYSILFSSIGFAQSQQHYYILFSARFPTFRPFSLGGHAFITWRSEDSAFHKVEQFTYGFFPKKGSPIFKSVDGLVVEGYVKNSRKDLLVRRFIIEVDSTDYVETLKEVDNWKKQSYNLFSNNCVDFMRDVAAKLKLNAPRVRACILPQKPFKYIKKLKKLNVSRIVKNDYLKKVRLRILKKAEVETEKDDEEVDN